MWSCGRLWSVCEVVVVPYEDAVVDVTVIHVLLFVLHVMLVWVTGGGVVAVSAYMGGTRGSGDMLEMSVVRGVCVWFGLEWCPRCLGERIGFKVYQSWRNMRKVRYVHRV